MIKAPVRNPKADYYGKKYGKDVNNLAKHVGVFTLEAKDFVLSFAVSAFGIKKPHARKTTSAVRRTKKARAK